MGWIWVLIASVPDHCIHLTFDKVSGARNIGKGHGITVCTMQGLILSANTYTYSKTELNDLLDVKVFQSH